MMKLAVNILDLDGIVGNRFVLALLFGQDIERDYVNIDRNKLDEVGVPVTCPADMFWAKLATIRDRGLPRVYEQGPRGGWRRMSRAEVAQHVDDIVRALSADTDT